MDAVTKTVEGGMMKTLDEVIKALETDPVPMAYTARLSVHEDIMTDALHYLQTYRADKEWLELEKRNYAEGVANCEKAEAKYTQMILDANRNEPLTWDALRQMEGKPVWVEGTIILSHWQIIDWVDDDKMICGDKLGIRVSLFKNVMGITWQAYRKERG